MVDKALNNFKEKKEIASILLFFIKRGDGISNTVLDFVHYLNNKNFKIYFVITHSKKCSEKTIKYRNEKIHQLKLKNTFTDKNLEMLNNDVQNIIAVNLKEDKEIGEFYGFREIYREIFNLFPKNFIDSIKRINKFKYLKQVLDFLKNKNYFFLNNKTSKEEFLQNAKYKLKEQIIISSGLASLVGLFPFPLADIPIILELEINLIKYAAKLYGFTDKEYNVLKLMTFPTGINVGSIIGGISKIGIIINFLDIIPFLGSLISPLINPAIILTFGYSINDYFYKKIGDKKVIAIINNTLNDYISIYLQIKELYNREFNNEKIK